MQQNPGSVTAPTVIDRSVLDILRKQADALLSRGSDGAGARQKNIRVAVYLLARLDHLVRQAASADPAASDAAGYTSSLDALGASTEGAEIGGVTVFDRNLIRILSDIVQTDDAAIASSALARSRVMLLVNRAINMLDLAVVCALNGIGEVVVDAPPSPFPAANGGGNGDAEYKIRVVAKSEQTRFPWASAENATLRKFLQRQYWREGAGEHDAQRILNNIYNTQAPSIEQDGVGKGASALKIAIDNITRDAVQEVRENPKERIAAARKLAASLLCAMRISFCQQEAKLDTARAVYSVHAASDSDAESLPSWAVETIERLCIAPRTAYEAKIAKQMEDMYFDQVAEIVAPEDEADADAFLKKVAQAAVPPELLLSRFSNGSFRDAYDFWCELSAPEGEQQQQQDAAEENARKQATIRVVTEQAIVTLKTMLARSDAFVEKAERGIAPPELATDVELALRTHCPDELFDYVSMHLRFAANDPAAPYLESALNASGFLRSLISAINDTLRPALRSRSKDVLQELVAQWADKVKFGTEVLGEIQKHCSDFPTHVYDYLHFDGKLPEAQQYTDWLRQASNGNGDARLLFTQDKSIDAELFGDARTQQQADASFAKLQSKIAGQGGVDELSKALSEESMELVLQRTGQFAMRDLVSDAMVVSKAFYGQY
jgi:hypothetical protein